METKNNFALTFILVLVVGLGFGYWVGNSRTSNIPRGMHMMPNGEMMSNTGTMSMGQMMMDMNAALRGKRGDDFDRAFLTEMIVHHEGAVEMAELALQNAKHQEIKDLASAIIAAQNKEIGDMKTWLKDWYNN